MDYILPEIFGTGMFDTFERLKYKNLDMSVSTLFEKVQEYEPELFSQEGGILVMNGKQNLKNQY